MGSSNFPNRPFRLEQRWSLLGQEQGNNRSRVHVELWIIKNSYSPTYSGSGSSFQMYLNGGLIAQNGNFGYDFRSSNELLLHASDHWVGHDAAGFGGFQLDSYCNADILGFTQVNEWFGLPRIPKPPDAPTPIGLDQITASSMRYRFSGNGDGGAAVIEWQYEYDDSGAGFPSPVTQGSSGTSTASPLLPGTRYWFRSRGRNSVGWGPWSSVIDATTLGAPPSVPLNLIATPTPPDKILLDWDPPSNTGGKPITGYDVQASLDPTMQTGIIPGSTDAATTQFQWTGLQPGQVYSVRVRAKNVDAVGVWSTPLNVLIPAGGSVWTGSLWKAALWKVWTGSLWKLALVKTWTGSIWKVSK